MFKSLSKKIAIDLSSAKIRIVVVDDLKNDVWELSPIEFASKVLEEDACLARRKDNHKLLAIGKQALEMRGRLDSFVEIVFPFHKSRIVDYEAAKVLMRELLKKTFNGLVFNPVAMVTTDVGATALTCKILGQFFYELGFAKVSLLAAPLGAAIGAGLPIADASGALLLQMGASGMTASIIALGSVLFSEASDWGGDRLDSEIMTHLAHTQNFAISIESARLLKEKVFSLNFSQSHSSSSPSSNPHAGESSSKRKLVVVGKTVSGSNPVELKIKYNDLQAIASCFELECESLINALLAQVPPELMSDVLCKGILLAGGLAQIHNLEEFLLSKFALPVARVDAPDMVVSMGAVAMLKHFGSFGENLLLDI